MAQWNQWPGSIVFRPHARASRRGKRGSGVPHQSVGLFPCLAAVTAAPILSRDATVTDWIDTWARIDGKTVITPPKEGKTMYWVVRQIEEFTT